MMDNVQKHNICTRSYLDHDANESSSQGLTSYRIKKLITEFIKCKYRQDRINSLQFCKISFSDESFYNLSAFHCQGKTVTNGNYVHVENRTKIYFAHGYYYSFHRLLILCLVLYENETLSLNLRYDCRETNAQEYMWY
jgi:hypothetical protein